MIINLLENYLRINLYLHYEAGIRDIIVTSANDLMS